jgi:hypothetical protein
MKCRIATISLLAASAALSDAAAQPRAGTVEWLYEQCKSNEPVRQDNCSAFLLGVAGAMEILGYTYENPPGGVNKDFVAALGAFGICSAPLTGADVRKAFVSWAEKNPTAWSERMPRGAMTALRATWPCTASK